MRVFGITGGSGSGKTSVSKIFANLGAEIIDTDKISREVTTAGSECLRELSAYFGDDILSEDGELDRRKLADRAFATEEGTKALSSITHKYIKKEVIKRIKNSEKELIGIDGAVIIGSNIEELCEFIVSVLADEKTRIARITERDAITEEQAKRRIKAQPLDEFYKDNSRYVIYNNRTQEELLSDVIALYQKIKEV